MHRFKYWAIALISVLTICPTQNEQAIAQARGGRVNLTGRWRVTSPAFHSIIPRETGCHSGSLPGSRLPATSTATLNIIQKGSSVAIPPFRSWVNVRQKRSGVFAIANSKVSNNVLTWTERGGGFTSSFKGTISKDGKKVTGRVFCQHTSGKATAQGPFSLTRIVSKTVQPPINGRG